MSTTAPRKVVKKKKKKNWLARCLLCVVLLGASAFFVYNIVQEGVTTYSLQVDINEAKTQLAQLKKENGSLVDQKEKLEDENYVKNYARGEYMISKEGEQIFHLPSNYETEEKK
ncbi:MAG: septum formation initiator family protein [Erysipelotrichaceae bacterium]|nr:septum formation initiator family protein [Erysipelotrichaceae bacterium]